MLTGAPYSGKTTTLNALKKKLEGKPHYRFIDELAMQYIHEQQDAGINPFKNLIQFENILMQKQSEAEEATCADGTCTIIDRSMIDNFAISQMLEVGIKEGVDVIGKLEDAVRKCKYDLVFILDRLPYQQTPDRMENSEKEVIKQDEFIRRAYNRFRDECGYQIIYVPVSSIEERASMIYKNIREFMAALSVKKDIGFSQAGIFAKLPASSETVVNPQLNM